MSGEAIAPDAVGDAADALHQLSERQANDDGRQHHDIYREANVR